MTQYSLSWMNVSRQGPREFTCGHCGNRVASDKGYRDQGTTGRIFICPYCTLPSMFISTTVRMQQLPGVRAGGSVEHVPEAVEAIYDEARDCYSVGAHTSAVLACRKLLMNLAVTAGADEGKTFAEYVDHLASSGYVPPNGKAWVDRIRVTGNEATHEIAVKSQEDAEKLIAFAEMLLKFVYEFPAKAAP